MKRSELNIFRIHQFKSYLVYTKRWVKLKAKQAQIWVRQMKKATPLPSGDNYLLPIIVCGIVLGSLIASTNLPIVTLFLPIALMLWDQLRLKQVLSWALFWLCLGLGLFQGARALDHPFISTKETLTVKTSTIKAVLKARKKTQPYSLQVDNKTYLLEWPKSKSPLSIGDQLSGKLTTQSIQPATNPGQFDYSKWLHRKGYTAQVKPLDITVKHHGSHWHPQNIAISIREALATRLKNYLPAPQDSLLMGLLFGITDPPLPDTLQAQFKQTGLTHILVVSGAQIALISGLCLQILSYLHLHKQYQWLILLGINTLFALITGLEASILRAILMFQLGLFFKWQQYPIRFLHLFSLVVFSLYLWNPLVISDIGAQLSIAATLGILYISPKLEALCRRWHCPNFLIIPMSLSMGPFILTAPLLWFHFQTLTPVAIIANILLLYPIEWIVILGAVTCIFLPIPILAKGLSVGLYWGLSVILSCVQVLCHLPGPIAIAKPHITICLMLYLAIFQSLSAKYTLNKALKSTAIGLFILIIYLAKPSPLTITFLDVGQGDATLIQTPDNHTYLIDTGPKTRYHNAAKKNIEPTLTALGINKLDGLIITHFDSDHVGGAPYLIKRYPIGFIWDNAQRYSKNSHYHTLIDQKKIPRLHLAVGQKIALSKNLFLTFLSPEPTTITTEDENNNSLCFRLDFKETSFLFTGDLELAGEWQLVQNWGHLLDVDILKAGHHGSKTSTTPALLDASSPHTVIISAGRHNRYNHPHPSVIKRLKNRSITIKNTQNSAQIITTY